VLIQWDTPGELSVMPAKVFEYLASRRYMLCVGSPHGGEVDRLLAKTHAGAIVRDVDSTAEAIAALYDEWNTTGFVADRTEESARAEWTQMAMAHAMEKAIVTATSRRVSS
jgi:hypothetical protein